MKIGHGKSGKHYCCPQKYNRIRSEVQKQVKTKEIAVVLSALFIQSCTVSIYIKKYPERLVLAMV